MMTDSRFFAQKQFLIVDDFEPIRASVKGMLQALGAVTIQTAGNAQRALALCQQQPFDFIVCDYNLGEGKDGYQLFEELKIRRLLQSHGIFMMISAETRRQVVHGLIELQPDDYLLKPFSYKTLQRRLLRAFYKKRILQEVYQLLATGNSEAALAECERIERQTPLRLPALRLKGEILLAQEEPARAAALYRTLLEERPDGWAALGLAICWMKMQRWDNARRLLLELLERDDTRLEAYDWLALVSLQTGLPSQALDYLQEAAQISPRNIKRQRSLANVAWLLGEYDIALKALRQVMRAARFSVHDAACHHIAYARCLLDRQQESGRGNPKELKQVISLLTESVRRYGPEALEVAEASIKARVEVLKGNTDSARQMLLVLLDEQAPIADTDDRMDLAKAWFAVGEQQRARLLLEETDDTAATVLELHAQSQQMLLEQLMARQRKIAARLQDLNDRGLQLYRNGLFDAATDIFMQAYEVMPSNAMLALNLLQSFTKGGAHKYPFVRFRAICQSCLEVLEATPLDHEQHQRYRFVRSEIDNLMVRG